MAGKYHTRLRTSSQVQSCSLTYSLAKEETNQSLNIKFRCTLTLSLKTIDSHLCIWKISLLLLSLKTLKSHLLRRIVVVAQ